MVAKITCSSQFNHQVFRMARDIQEIFLGMGLVARIMELATMGIGIGMTIKRGQLVYYLLAVGRVAQGYIKIYPRMAPLAAV